MPEMREVMENNFPELKQPVLRVWEDMMSDPRNALMVHTWYANHDCDIANYHYGHLNHWYLHVPSGEHANSMLAFAKLSILMDDLDDECKVDWEDWSDKYIIKMARNNLWNDTATQTYHFLAFKTEKVRDAFRKKHEELIKIYFMMG